MTLFSLAGSPDLANRTPLPESGLVKMMSATCGPRCLGLFGRFPQNGLWAKMFSALLIGQEGWFSRRCKLIWSVKVTKYNRTYFQLRVLTLHTNEIGSGLLLTPTTREEVMDIEKFKSRMEKYPNGTTMPNLATQVMGFLKTPTKMDWEVTSGKANPVSGNSGTLAQEIMSGYPPTMQKLGLMLPTPTAFDWNSARTPEKWEEDKAKWAEKGVNLQMPLKQMARFQMLPTPTVNDSKNSTMPDSQLNREDNLTKRFHHLKEIGKTSQLNPQFVLEMMGFPPDWTLLPFLSQSGETNQSKLPETP